MTEEDFKPVIQVLNDLLKCPMPYDLLDIRKGVKTDYGGDEELAKEEMDAWCTEEFALSEASRHHEIKNRAFDILNKYKDLL